MRIVICPECAKRFNPERSRCPDCGWTDPKRLGRTATPVEVPLGGGKVALIDDEDADLIEQYQWEMLSRPWTNYAVATHLADGTPLKLCHGCGTRLTMNPTGRWPQYCPRCRRQPKQRRSQGPWPHDVIPMHWLIVDSYRRVQIHHYNGDGLDNRRKNLIELDHRDHKKLHAAAKAGKETTPSGHPTPLGIERHGYPAPPRTSKPRAPVSNASESRSSCLLFGGVAVLSLVVLACFLALLC